MKVLITLTNASIFTLSSMAQCPTGAVPTLSCGTPITVTNTASGVNGAVSQSAPPCQQGGGSVSFSDIYAVTYQPGVTITLDHAWSQFQNADTYMTIINSTGGCPTITCNYLSNTGVGGASGISFVQNPNSGYNNQLATMTTSLDQLGLTPGQTVYIKITTDKKTAGGGNGGNASGGYDYTLNCQTVLANSCANAQSMLGGTTYSVSTQFGSDYIGNNDAEGAGCGYSIENNMMFQWCTDVLNTPVNVIVSNWQVIEPAGGSGQFAVVQGPCGGPYSTIQCNSMTGNGTIAINPSNTAASNCYWIMFDGNAGTWWNANIQLQNASPVILPVELISFDGKATEQGNQLSWQTLTESHNDYFVVERSIDGENWVEVATVDGAGSSRDILNYSITDNAFASNTMNYYRLSQVDFDGTNRFYDLLAIDNRLPVSHITGVYDLTGQPVDLNTAKGIVIIHYTDGSVEKRMQY